MTDIITRKVFEAYTRDVGRGVIRMDYDTMDDLQVSTGDSVQIESSVKKSVAKTLPIYPSDEGKKIIRIDKMTRENIKTDIGGEIKISKIKASHALSVSFYQIEESPPLDERYLTDALENNYVIKGDLVAIPYFGSKVIFKVINTEPEGVVLITQHTKSMIIEDESHNELNDFNKYIENRKNILTKERHKQLIEFLKEKNYNVIKEITRNYNTEILELTEMKKNVHKIFSDARNIKDVN